MSLGVVAIWNDITPAMRAEFFEWHNRQHMPERVGIPGFRRGRRYIAIDAAPEFFTLYETDTPQVLAGPDYLARLNQPTPWTRHVTQDFRNTCRSLCTVLMSHGVGQGAFLTTLRYDVQAGREEEQRRLIQQILPALADQPGVVGAHLCVADQVASAIETEEKKGQPKGIVWNWVVLIEGGSEPGLLAAACHAALDHDRLRAAGASDPIVTGLYQLQFSR